MNRVSDDVKRTELWRCFCNEYPCKSWDDTFAFIDNTKSFKEIIEQKANTTTPDNAMKWQVMLVGMIANCLIDYMDFLNRKNTMSYEQVKQTAMLIYEEYQYITAPDLVMFNRLCKLGHFGDLKDLNGTTFIQWFKKYFKERFDKFNDYRYQQEMEGLKNRALPESDLSPDETNKRFVRLQECMKSFGKANKQVVQQPKEESRKDKIEKIRLKVIREHLDLLSQPDYDSKINTLIEQAIAEAGLKD